MASRPRLLAAASDPGIRRLLSRHFSRLGFQVAAVDTARSVIDQIGRLRPNITIVSADLGTGGGVALVREVRAQTPTPLIVLRQSNTPCSLGDLLDAGADDSLDEPFLIEELAARSRRVLKRDGIFSGPRALVTPLGRLEIDGLERQVRLNGTAIDMTRKQFDLLAILAGGNGAVVGHDDIQHRLWGGVEHEGRQNLRRLIGGLRGRIEPVPASPVCVLGVRASGYRLAVMVNPDDTDLPMTHLGDG